MDGALSERTGPCSAGCSVGPGSCVSTRHPRNKRMNIFPLPQAPAFVPWDIEVARINFGANCGPASFAAVTRREVCRVIGHFPHFERVRWTNLTQMLRAFAEAGYSTEVRRRVLPAPGVALVQWLGPWTEQDFV